MLDQLKTLDPDGNPPLTRIARASDGYEIWNQLRMADSVSSFERARWDAMYDNVPPLDQKQLDANGQSYRVNVGWDLAKMVLDMGQAGYIDVLNSTETLIECPTEADIPEEERKEAEDIIAEEVTNCIRSWPDFSSSYLQLTSTLIKQAVSFGTFDDDLDWRFDAKGLSDVKISRKTKVGQGNIDVACWLRFYSMSQLYQFIKHPEHAEQMGWNVEAVKAVIMRAINNSNTFTQWRNYEWEKIEIELRNNDYYWTYGIAQTQNIRIVHMVWQEFDGRYSYGILTDDQTQNGEWLYHKVGRFSSSYNAFVAFTYGVGNGYYHGIRGQGYTIYPIVGALNRAYCQLLEVGTYGSAPTIHLKDESKLQEFQFTPSGAYNLMAGDVEMIPSSIVPNISTGVLPIVQTFTNIFREQTANANTQALIESPKEMTAAEVNARLGSVAKMSTSSLNLFYPAWECLLREMVRRMKRKDYSALDPGGNYIMELHRKLIKRGGKRLLEAFFKLDTTRLKAKRAIGSGSEAARLLAFNQLMQILPYLDEYGRQNVIRDYVAGYVGYRNTDRYIQPVNAEQRPPLEASVAELQNDALLGGGVATVRPNDNHLIHARVHSEALIPLVQQANDAITVDPLAVAGLMQGLQQLNAHLAEHVERLAIDPIGQKLVAQYKKVLQQADEVIHNGLLKIQKLQEQQAAEAQEQGEQFQPQVDPKVLADIENKRLLTEAQIESIQIKAQASAQATLEKGRQQQALNDAETAQSLRANAAKANQQIVQTARQGRIKERQSTT